MYYYIASFTESLEGLTLICEQELSTSTLCFRKESHTAEHFTCAVPLSLYYEGVKLVSCSGQKLAFMVPAQDPSHIIKQEVMSLSS